MTDICSFDELADGIASRFTVDGTDVAVVRIGDDVYAIDDICSHANVSLSEGGEVWCDELELECPKHSSASASSRVRPAHFPQRSRLRCTRRRSSMAGSRSRSEE